MGGLCGCFAGVAPASNGNAKTIEKQEKPLVPPKEVKTDAKQKDPTPPAPQAVDPDPPAPVSAPPVLPDAGTLPAGTDTDLSVGRWVDVYSNSCQAWCPGVVYDVDASSYFAAYQVPGEPSESNINTKTLPKDSEEIKVAAENGAWSRATVEVAVLDEAKQKVVKIGRITNFSGGVATIKEISGDVVIATLPSEDKNIALPGAENAMNYRQGPLTIGSPVEVYSRSMECWCYGVVQSINPQGLDADGSVPSVAVAFFYPDMDPQTEEPAIKELPMDHPDLRVSMPPVANAAPVTEADLQIGTSVEVYSESRAAWLPGIVKELQEGTVVTLLKYPDMPEDNNLFEKELPIGHAYIRLPALA
jgi:hypothetical protein